MSSFFGWICGNMLLALCSGAAAYLEKCRPDYVEDLIVIIGGFQPSRLGVQQKAERFAILLISALHMLAQDDVLLGLAPDDEDSSLNPAAPVQMSFADFQKAYKLTTIGLGRRRKVRRRRRCRSRKEGNVRLSQWDVISHDCDVLRPHGFQWSCNTNI